MSNFLSFTRQVIFTEPEYVRLPSVFRLIENHGETLAFKELSLIWECNSYRSLSTKKGWSKDRIFKEGKLRYDLPEDWTPDEYYFKAEKDFIAEEEDEGIAIKVIKTLYRSLALTERGIEKLNEEVARLIEKGSLSKIEISDLVTILNQITILAKDIPSKLTDLKQGEELARKESQEKKSKRGQGEVSPSMLRDNA